MKQKDIPSKRVRKDELIYWSLLEIFGCKGVADKKKAGSYFAGYRDKVKERKQPTLIE